MSDKDAGGYAFPTHFNGMESPDHGMTLRDYFAAKAMATFLHGSYLPQDFDATNQLIILAMRCYEVADAMIKERNK